MQDLKYVAEEMQLRLLMRVRAKGRSAPESFQKSASSSGLSEPPAKGTAKNKSQTTNARMSDSPKCEPGATPEWIWARRNVLEPNLRRAGPQIWLQDI